MKKLFFTVALICFSMTIATAQSSGSSITEPDFIGEVLTILPDSTSMHLEKEHVMTRTRANASALIFGIGKAKKKLIIENPKAEVRLNKDNDIYFIVRTVDNNSDPIAIVNIFRFEVTDKRRLAEVASISSFGSVKSNKLYRLEFTAKKFGTSSYLLKLKDKPTGEFGITVVNPNSKDEKNVIVATFAID